MKKLPRLFPYGKVIVFVFFALCACRVEAGTPQSMQSVTYNFTSFTAQLKYKNLELLYAVNHQKNSHPDFGKVARGEKPEWYEQYGKRTATTRSFVMENGAVVSGYAYTPINYLDVNGDYVAINASLSPSANGWSAMQQQFPTFL